MSDKKKDQKDPDIISDITQIPQHTRDMITLVTTEDRKKKEDALRRLLTIKN